MMKNDKNDTIWIEFQAWMGNTSICGYMALDEADDDAPLQFYGVDGLECGCHISQTNNNTFEWEKLSQWFAVTDVVQYLVDFAEESKRLLFAHEDDWGRIDTVELYINCSKLDGD